MASSLDGWIHNFTVTDVCTHKKGFSVYKITSIVFPVNIPETLTCVTVWKRFNEIKKLRKIMAKQHKQLHLRGIMPDLKEENFFNRFDEHVIQQRKQFILNLLDFISQFPSLYKMHAFQSFFEISHSPSSSDDSPERFRKRSTGAIESIYEELDVPMQPTLSLIDPNKDLLHTSRNDETPNSSSTASSSLKSEDSCSTELNLNECVEVPEIPVLINDKSIDQVDSSDYIFEAALSFSEAVKFEANGCYRQAFDNYKRGIETLLTGAKHDVIADRKRIATEKTKKYLARAEQIHEQFLLNDDSLINSDNPSISTIAIEDCSIERPIDQLSRFKVIKILENVMQVQDSIDKEIYIMKAVEKPSSNNLPQTICLPQNIPFMQASGGRLWDYIRSYEPAKHTLLSNRTASLASLFTEPNDRKSSLPVISNDNSKQLEESPFMAMLNQYRNIDYSRSNSNQSGLSEMIENLESNADIPSFDVLSDDMDVLDLVNCSQKLIRSVSNTLNQSRHILNSTITSEHHIAQSTDGKPIANNICTSPLLELGKPIDEHCRLLNGTMKRIPERSIKRWASEMVVCLLSLHEKEILCGDLNPNNLLLGLKGQINLTYFYRQDQRQLKIDCIDGLYVAPERPLDYRSDWWSFGVILFELLTGESFVCCHPKGVSSYYEIQYPDVVLSDESKYILNELLQADPENRLVGHNVQNHRFFKNINWNEIQDDGKSFETKKCFNFIHCD